MSPLWRRQHADSNHTDRQLHDAGTGMLQVGQLIGRLEAVAARLEAAAERLENDTDEEE